MASRIGHIQHRRTSTTLDAPALAELGNRTAEQVLLEDPQSSDVEAVLTRIDYGVYG